MLQNVHICCLVLGLLLLATSVTRVQGAEETIYTDLIACIRRTISASECTLTLPDKTVCHYAYGAGSATPTTPPPLPGEICEIPANLYPSYGPCDFKVDILANYNRRLTGVYTLKYKLSNGTVGEDTFYVYLRNGGVPTDELQVVENENVYLRLRDSFETNTSKKCEVIGPNNTYEVLLGSSGKSPNYWGNEDECGFKVEGVTTSDSGNWTLRMSSSGGAYTFEVFVVTVIPLDEINTGPNPLLIWRFGEQGTLSMTTQPTKYCEIWNPKKELVQRACNYTQNIVTDADRGDWTFVFGIDGKLTNETLVQRVAVLERYFKATVSVSERFTGGKSLLCDIYFTLVTDCRFTRPDGEVLLLNEGIGNANYSYFGDGFSRGHCGLTIHNVTEEDKGVWKCSVAHRSTQWSGFLNVSSEFPDIEIETHRTPVVVKDGSELQLSCSAQRPVEYCWFRHPTGVAFRFSTDNILQDQLYRNYKYEDTLQEGVCTIRVLSAISSEDSGEWTCNLGVIGSPEEDYAKPITVRFAETDVISLEKEVVVSEGPAVLKCYSVPLGTPLEYCRFVRPDGKGFNVDPRNNNTVLRRYQYEAEGLVNGECGLRISEINEDEDVGKWTCMARLQGRKEEGQDYITVKTDDVVAETNRRIAAVRNGEELQLSCSDQRALEYCWFRHPSGVALRFSTEWVSLDQPYRQYVYSNTLQQGVCTIRVLPAISSEDSGDWTCNLGILGSPAEDNAKPILVGFAESDVISMEKELTVSEGPAVLKCYSVPLGIPLEYCRFIRPDGKGFNVVPNNNTVLGRYRYEAEGLAKGECGLRIVSEINEDEDVGTWTCLARLQRRRKEGHDFITLKADDGLSTGAIIGIVLGAVALLLVIGGTAYLIARCRKAT